MAAAPAAFELSPHEEQQSHLLDRIVMNVTKLNEVVEELNEKLAEINEYNADLSLVSRIWHAYNQNARFAVEALHEGSQMPAER